MTIEQIKKEKVAAEKKISEVLTEFYNNTGGAKISKIEAEWKTMSTRNGDAVTNSVFLVVNL